ncbi:hypothetical protein [Candidatus Borrarchaeum sp.]|uniref:hypothetical protein n=1 Tax=Candidatus Borrarchaeum sp. TaxID=2846742 RepID=UPI0025800F61|nr:hypothetical protein [Candidatus Borrarchaeum sp.]
MTAEGEVSCGVIKWLIDQQIDWNQEKHRMDIGFWIDRLTFNAACDFLETNQNENDLVQSLENEFGISSEYLEKHWLGVQDFSIPWDNHSLTPDIMSHVYHLSDAYSETWAIECKGDAVDSIKRGFLQVIGHGKVVNKSFIALPEEFKSMVIDLKNNGYGILPYNSNNREIIFEDSIQTKADPKLLNYFNKYLRDLHLKKRVLPFLYGKPFMQRRIALLTNLSIALHIFYNQEKYKENGIEEARIFSQILEAGQMAAGISNIEQHIADLIDMELINDNYEVSDRAKSFFHILDRELVGNNDIEKINHFREMLPSIQQGILYQQSEFGFFVANLLKIFLSSNKSIQEFIGWISQASQEAGSDTPVFAHVITIGLKQNPLLLTEMLLFKRTATIPRFQLNLARPRPNACATCPREDKIDFCFCGGDESRMFEDVYTSHEQREPFQERYNEFFDVWTKTIPIEIFSRNDLRNKYVKIFKYQNENEVEILAPCFIKCLLHTNINKTTAILKHIGILGEDVRSGLKAELCTRFDPLYLNPEMVRQTEIIE